MYNSVPRKSATCINKISDCERCFRSINKLWDDGKIFLQQKNGIPC